MLGYIPGKVTLVLLKLSRNAFWPPTSLKSAGISSLWPQLFPRSGLPGLLGKGEWGKQGWECWEKSICSLQGFPKYSHRFHRDYGCERRAPGELGEGKVNMESLEWMGNPQDSIPWTVTRNQGPAFSCCWDLAWLCPHPLPRFFFPWKSKTLLQSTPKVKGKHSQKSWAVGKCSHKSNPICIGVQLSTWMHSWNVTQFYQIPLLIFSINSPHQVRLYFIIYIKNLFFYINPPHQDRFYLISPSRPSQSN